MYIRVTLTGGGHRVSCEISYKHDQFTSLIKDGEELCAAALTGALRESVSREELSALSIADALAFAEAVPLEEVDFVLGGARINMELALHAAEHPYGLSVGRIVLAGIPDKLHTLDDAVRKGAGLAASASDARMSGCPKAVVINSGSGNQGITCSVPLVTVADYLKCGEEKLTRALCLSQLVALTLTAKKDRLSALCGAFTAAIGTACGFVYLLGGGRAEMDMTVRTMVANLTGIVCDGAKKTCALKIYSCIEAAGLSCRLALEGQAPSNESGIIGQDAIQTIDHLARISHEGMLETDKTILSIMLNT